MMNTAHYAAGILSAWTHPDRLQFSAALHIAFVACEEVGHTSSLESERRELLHAVVEYLGSQQGTQALPEHSQHSAAVLLLSHLSSNLFKRSSSQEIPFILRQKN